MRRRVSKLERNQLTLSPSAVENAAAFSIARFAILLSWSLILFSIRVSFLWYYMSSWWQKAIILISECGRLAMVIFQELSIMTYSCQYKGVSTWGTAPSARMGKYWNEEKQKEFKNAVLDEIGRHYFAKCIFLGIERVWHTAYPLSSWMFPPDHVGEFMFAKFCSPAADRFTEGNDLIVTVHEKWPSAEEKHLYSITFRRVPDIVVREMQSYLMPSTEQRLWFGYPTLIPALAGIIAPILFTLGQPSTFALIYWLVEQSIVNLVKYYDFSECSINSKFDASLDIIGELYEGV